MPKSAPTPCPTCRHINCTVHTRKAYDVERGSSSKRLYTYRWQQARLRFLRDNPLCKPCLDEGYIKAAFAVDHRIPHRGDESKFWDQSNWQPMCESHHNSKARGERLT